MPCQPLSSMCLRTSPTDAVDGSPDTVCGLPPLTGACVTLARCSLHLGEEGNDYRRETVQAQEGSSTREEVQQLLDLTEAETDVACIVAAALEGESQFGDNPVRLGGREASPGVDRGQWTERRWLVESHRRVEFAVTGGSALWVGKSGVWQATWRNLNQATSCHVGMGLIDQPESGSGESRRRCASALIRSRMTARRAPVRYFLLQGLRRGCRLKLSGVRAIAGRVCVAPSIPEVYYSFAFSGAAEVDRNGHERRAMVREPDLCRYISVSSRKSDIGGVA